MIAPTDLDGLVERNGRFLVLEAKGPGKTVTRGQQITIDALQKNGAFTIVIIWGDQNVPEKLRVITRKKTIEYDPADLEKLRCVVSKWYSWADQQKAA